MKLTPQAQNTIKAGNTAFDARLINEADLDRLKRGFVTHADFATASKAVENANRDVSLVSREVKDAVVDAFYGDGNPASLGSSPEMNTAKEWVFAYELRDAVFDQLQNQGELKNLVVGVANKRKDGAYESHRGVNWTQQRTNDAADAVLAQGGLPKGLGDALGARAFDDTVCLAVKMLASRGGDQADSLEALGAHMGQHLTAKAMVDDVPPDGLELDERMRQAQALLS